MTLNQTTDYAIMKEDLNDYKDAYNTDFKFFDENHWYLSMYRNIICNRIQEMKSRSILSLGIGHNVVSDGLISLIDNGLQSYHIVEGSETIIKRFREKHPSSRIAVFNSYFEDFTPAVKYDAIEMGFVLEHVDDPRAILEKFKSFLNDDGAIFIAVPNARSLHRVIGHKAGLLDNLYQLSPSDHQLGHKRYFDLESIRKLISDAGLAVTAEKGLMLKPVTGDQIVQLGWSDNIIQALLEVGLQYTEIANCMYLEARP